MPGSPLAQQPQALLLWRAHAWVCEYSCKNSTSKSCTKRPSLFRPLTDDGVLPSGRNGREGQGAGFHSLLPCCLQPGHLLSFPGLMCLALPDSQRPQWWCSISLARVHVPAAPHLARCDVLDRHHVCLWQQAAPQSREAPCF